MKRPVLHDFQRVLALLVLAAATIDLLLPSPHCTDSGVVPKQLTGQPHVAGQCISSRTMTISDQREP